MQSSDRAIAARDPRAGLLNAIIDAAVVATDATMGWIVVQRGDELVVVAAAGDRVELSVVGATAPAGSGASGYAIASAQPLALSGSANDGRLSEGIAASIGTLPSTVLCVPCGSDDDAIGAIELIDKAGGARFSIDDMELTALFAAIASEALAAEPTEPPVPAPSELAAELSALASHDHHRYASIALLIKSVLPGD